MASERWKVLLAEDPDNELVRISLAKDLVEEGAFAEARGHLERLVAEQPDFALGWAWLARCCLAEGDRDAARAACEKGLPLALQQKHETPESEIRAVLDELDAEF